jgi:hypothetical protein
MPASSSPPTGEAAPIIEPPAGTAPPVPVATPAASYAPASVYDRKAVRSPEGFPWENKSREAMKQLGTDVPERLKVKIKWLADQFKAGRLSQTTQEKLITDTLQSFVRRELLAWGVPPNHAED